MKRCLALFLFSLLISVFCFQTPAWAADATSGLVGWWTFDEGSGTSAGDSAGSNTGTLVNSPTWTGSGHINGALIFANASSKYVDVANPANFNFERTQPFSLAAWVYRTATTNENDILAKNNGSPNYAGYGLAFDSSSGTVCGSASGKTNSLFMYVENQASGPSNAACIVVNNSAATPNVWHHIVGTYDGSSTAAGLNIYVDGVLQTPTTTLNTLTASALTAVDLNIGARTSGNVGFDGTLDDARVYNRTLSAADVTALYSQTACARPGGFAGDVRYSQQWRTVQYCDGGNWVNTGKSTYAAPAVNCDGSTTYLVLLGAANGAASGKVTGSFWVQRLGNFGVKQVIYSTYRTTLTNTRFEISFNASNQLEIIGWDDSGTPGVKKLDVTSAKTFTDSNWHHILFSIDLASAANRSIYIDDAADAATWGTYVVGSTIAFTTAAPNDSVCAIPNGSSKFTGSLADLWLDINTFTDFSVTTNRRKFIDAGLNPVYLGAAGATPNGASPEVFLSDSSASTWPTNKGTGGGFTLNGTMKNAGDTSGTGNIANGLVGYWKLDDGSGTSAADSSGAGNTGTLTNNPTWTTGQLNGALTFNGTNQYVSMGNPSALQITGSLTLTAWINGSAFGASDYPIITKHNPGASNKSYALQISSGDCGSNTVDIVLSPDGSSNAFRCGSTVLAAGTWYFVAGVYDASAQTAHIYINGVLSDGALTGTVPSSLFNPAQSVYIGTKGGLAYFFPGTIDDARIYNRALSAAEIYTLYMYRGWACASPVDYAGDFIYNSASHVMQYCDGVNWQPMGKVPGAGGAGCSNPAGSEADLRYNGDKHYLQYCDGTNWVAAGGLHTATTAGLAGWWKLDDASSGTAQTTAADSSGQGNTGTTQNSPTWTSSGQVGNALILNGTTQYVYVNDAASLQLAGSWTVSGWTKLAGLPAGGSKGKIIEKQDAGFKTNYALGVDNTAGCTGIGWRVAFNDSGGALYQTCYVTTVNTGTWYHVAGVWDSSTSNLMLYLNGVLVATNNYAGHVPTSASGNPLALGQQGPAGTQYLNGTLDEVRLYSRALSAPEVWDLYLGTGGT